MQSHMVFFLRKERKIVWRRPKRVAAIHISDQQCLTKVHRQRKKKIIKIIAYKNFVYYASICGKFLFTFFFLFFCKLTINIWSCIHYYQSGTTTTAITTAQRCRAEMQCSFRVRRAKRQRNETKDATKEALFVS